MQAKDTTLQEAISAVNLAKAFYRRQRTDESFCRFYEDVLDAASKLKIGEPLLPRNRRAPRRFDNGSEPHHYGTPKDYYRRQYFEAVIYYFESSWEDRFEQRRTLPPVLSLENIL